MSIEQIPVDTVRVGLSALGEFDTQNDQPGSLKNGVARVYPEESTSQVAKDKSPVEQQGESQKSAIEGEDKLNLSLLDKATTDEQQQDKEEVERTLDTINQLIPLKNTNLVFEFDEINEPPIVKVVDKDTDEVIREIPPQNIRKIAQALNDMADSLDKSGALFNSKV